MKSAGDIALEVMALHRIGERSRLEMTRNWLVGDAVNRLANALLGLPSDVTTCGHNYVFSSGFAPHDLTPPVVRR